MGVSASVSLNLNLSQATTEVLAAAQHGLDLAGEELIALSTPRAPIQDGTLRGSASLGYDLADRAAGDPSVLVTYDTPYAARLHEHPEYNFQEGGGKYLEDPAMENKDALGDIVAEQMRRAGA